jgi:subtilisin family serine protease
MKQRYVVLRGLQATRPRTSGPGGPTPGPAGTAAAPMPRIEYQLDELDPREARDVERSSGVLAIAPSMPMRLIAPLGEARDITATPAAATATWGVKAVRADTSTFTGTGIAVAVLDTGIDAAHAAFTGVTIVERDFTGEGNGDLHGHGTHCAGTIFGREVQNTRIGVAPGVTRAFIGKVLGANGGTSDEIVNAIQWAVDQGAHVISMSLGMDFPGFVKFLVEDQGLPIDVATTVALEGYRQNVTLFERLSSLVTAIGPFGQPSLIVAAAGNESGRDATPPFEIACAPPAVSEGLVSVAALGQVGSTLDVAPFSNTNAIVAAPGVSVTSARAGGGLVSMSGTSMATPHVAGVAVLWAEKILSQGPLRATEWMARLIASGMRDGLKAGIDPNDIGSGLVQAPQ